MDLLEGHRVYDHCLQYDYESGDEGGAELFVSVNAVGTPRVSAPGDLD